MAKIEIEKGNVRQTGARVFRFSAMSRRPPILEKSVPAESTTGVLLQEILDLRDKIESLEAEARK